MCIASGIASIYPHMLNFNHQTSNYIQQTTTMTNPCVYCHIHVLVSPCTQWKMMVTVTITVMMCWRWWWLHYLHVLLRDTCNCLLKKVNSQACNFNARTTCPRVPDNHVESFKLVESSTCSWACRIFEQKFLCYLEYWMPWW